MRGKTRSGDDDDDEDDDHKNVFHGKLASFVSIQFLLDSCTA